MKFSGPISVLLGIALNLHGVASAIVPVDYSLDTTTSINATTLDDWPPFYKTHSPQDLCGDTFSHDKSSSSVPNPKDCAALRDNLDANPGLWNITADTGRGDVYVLLASHGTCTFVAAPLDSGKNCLIGSKDARDLLNDQATYYSKYSISSTMGCADNAATNWAVIRQ